MFRGLFEGRENGTDVNRDWAKLTVMRDGQVCKICSIDSCLVFSFLRTNWSWRKKHSRNGRFASGFWPVTVFARGIGCDRRRNIMCSYVN